MMEIVAIRFDPDGMRGWPIRNEHGQPRDYFKGWAQASGQVAWVVAQISASGGASGMGCDVSNHTEDDP